MSRCRETAGILFNRKCHAEAVGTCSECKKPVCQTHSRNYWESVTCITCLRELIKQKPTEKATRARQKQTKAHLRDDPFFYWYYVDDVWFNEPYGDDDFALFTDTGGGDFGGDSHDTWEGT